MFTQYDDDEVVPWGRSRGDDREGFHDEPPCGFYQSYIDDLVAICRHFIENNKTDQPPYTHICGMSVDDVERKIAIYAKGDNMGSLIARKYPW